MKLKATPEQSELLQNMRQGIEQFLEKYRKKEACINSIHDVFQLRLNRLSRQRVEAMLKANSIFERPASSLAAKLPPLPDSHQPILSTLPPTPSPSKAAINRPTNNVVAAAPKQTNLWPWIFGIGAGISFCGGVAGLGYKLLQRYKTKQKRRRKNLVKPVKRKYGLNRL